MKANRIILLLIGALLSFGGAPSASADSGADLVKEFAFESKGGTPEYDAPERIKKDGRTYRLTGIDYVAKDNVTVKKTYRLGSRDELDRKDIRYRNEEGREITLKFQEAAWSEEEVTLSQEYKSEAAIPEMMPAAVPGAEEGEELEIDLFLSNVRDASRHEEFSAPAVFYGSAPDVRKFAFGGKTVTISGESPVWDGYEEDVKEYLAITGNDYAVTGGKWTSGFEKTEEGYARRAEYTGTKSVPLFEATFTGTVYEAEATYTGTDPSAAGDMTAVASYERTFGLREGLLIGAGALVLALAAAAVLFVIRRRRKEDDA